MIKELLSDPASAALCKSLQGTSARQQAIADNIANIETPGYVRKEVSFAASLREAISSGDDPRSRAERISAITPFTVSDTSRAPKADGNNVDVDHEMAALAENTLEFESSATALSLKVRMLRTAINEGRR